MVDTKDILRKAAEDAQQGMWCRVKWFDGHLINDWKIDDRADDYRAYQRHLSVEQMEGSYRCAEGSVMLATRLLGGSGEDYAAAVSAVESALPTRLSLWMYNDFNLPDDPFEAGQQLAELFRQTADSL